MGSIRPQHTRGLPRRELRRGGSPPRIDSAGLHIEQVFDSASRSKVAR